MDTYTRWSLCALSIDGMHSSQGPRWLHKDAHTQLQLLTRRQHLKILELKKRNFEGQVIQNNIKELLRSAVCWTVPLDWDKCEYFSIIHCIFSIFLKPHAQKNGVPFLVLVLLPFHTVLAPPHNCLILDLTPWIIVKDYDRESRP